jgi:hypothetical protein
VTPILMVAAVLSGHEWAGYGPGRGIAAGTGGMPSLAPLLTIVLRQRNPHRSYSLAGRGARIQPVGGLSRSSRNRRD